MKLYRYFRRWLQRRLVARERALLRIDVPTSTWPKLADYRDTTDKHQRITGQR